MRILFTICISFFCFQPLWSQISTKLYTDIIIYPDWTVEFKNEAKEDIKGKQPYFIVEQDENFIVSIAYFDAWNKKAQYLLDDVYQVYFSQATISYTPGQGKPEKRIAKMDLVDFLGLPVGYVQYLWDNKHIMGRDGNIRNAVLYKYSSMPRGFFPKANRFFTFSGGAFNRNIASINETNKQTGILFDRQFYESGRLVRKERTDSYNERAYTEYYNYSFGKLKSVQTYNKNGVKLKEVLLE